MFLRTLTLKGFKSFAETTPIDLEPGVTVVVGPNGSGKSNIVDAIAWVLGAQAPSAVRSQKMDDVIFAGSATKAALGRAEVSLTIDNSAGLLPIDFSEVTISRTLWRSGESEYALNGVPCRLLDIQELLSDSGVGRQQHTIVSQGQIDAVLNARPEERRAIIEEAAGVLKFRKRKEKAERRLEATEANLLRVQDLLREVRRQLRPLERQAEAARRHGSLVAELTSLRVFITGREIQSQRARLEALAFERREFDRVEREVKVRLSSLDTDVMAEEARLGAQGGLDLGDALARAEQLRERARGLAGVLAERRRSLERDRSALLSTEVVANLEAEAAEHRQQLVVVNTAELELGPLTEALEVAEQQLADARAAIDGSLGDGRATVAQAAAEARGELAALRAATTRGEEELSRSDRRSLLLSERATRLADDVSRRQAEQSEANAAEAPIVEELTRAEADRVAAEETFAAAEHAHRALISEYAGWEARVDALTMALDEAHDRAGAARLVDVDGVVGTLLDLVEIDAGWEGAFEAATGEALAAVVVRDRDAARAALAVLREGGGYGAVLALGQVPVVGPVPALGPVPAPLIRGANPVRDHVRARDIQANALLDHLLGRAFAVEGSWDDALDIAIANPDAIVVTRDGDRFASSGWSVGVARSGATKTALDEARERSITAAEAVDRAASELDRARVMVSRARALVVETERRLDRTTARAHAASETLERLLAEQHDAETENESLGRGRGEILTRLQGERDRASELEALLPVLELEESAEAEQVRALQASLARVDEASRKVSALRTDLEVKTAAIAERRIFLQRRINEIDARLVADTAERQVASTRRERVDAALIAVDRLAALVREHAATLDIALAELGGERRRQSDAARAIAARLETLRRERGDNERRLESSREMSRRADIEEAEVKMRLEQLVATARHELDVEPDAAMASAVPIVPEGGSPAGRARDLDRELRLMGPINPLALEEFTALRERHEFLETQLEDVRSSRSDLRRVIHAVDTEIQSVFAAAYADVALNFEQLFHTLFPGGYGRLVLTTPEDLLNTGIEVEAKPSGKNVKKLSLLSGGERSLTALAFLFAVFRSRPSPFYVMDEVEAALDDVNLHRFLSLIDEFRDEAQLLIVSHQKRTMEAADCLFGVTMQSGGSSKVVSERVTAGR